MQANKQNVHLFEKLPQRIKEEFWMPIAKQYHERLMKKQGRIISEGDQLFNNELINYKKGIHERVITAEAISKAIAFIDKYVDARDDLCYLGSFRKRIQLPQ